MLHTTIHSRQFANPAPFPSVHARTDVVTIEKTGEHFRLIYDVKGRFTIHRISDEESKYKLCKVRKTVLGTKNVPFLVTHDGRTIRYPDPIIKANDTIQLDIATSKITDHIKFDSGKWTGRAPIVASIVEHRRIVLFASFRPVEDHYQFHSECNGSKFGPD